MILSIIIPVYNVEKYIESCMESMYMQNIPFDQYEVIVINDGTQDNSMEIVRNYSSYPNLTIIEQPNSGLSVTRNVGLRAAKGDFVWFVDSDDSIEQNCLLDITTDLVSLNSDLFAYKIKQIDEQTGEFVVRPHKTGQRLTSIKTGVDYFISGAFYSPIQMFIMKRTFLMEKKLFFKEGIFHEDLELAPKVLYHATRLSIIDQSYYRYLLRATGSITTTFNPQRPKDLLSIYKSLYVFHKENVTDKHLKSHFLKTEFGLILLSIDVLRECSNTSFIKQFLKENIETYRSASLRVLPIRDVRFNFFALLILLHPLVALKYYQLRK